MPEDELSRTQLSEQLQAVARNVVDRAFEKRGMLPQTASGKRKSVSRDSSFSSGGLDGDVGSEDGDVDV